MKKLFFLIIPACLVLIAGCSKKPAQDIDPGLEGKWEQLSGGYSILDGLVDVFEFTGKEFSHTQYSEEGSYPAGCYGGLCTDDDLNNKELVVELPGDGGYKYYRIVTKGTFSVSGDMIEFKLSDGYVKPYSFSRAGNAIIINGREYINR